MKALKTLSHKLTDDQIIELKDVFGIGMIIELSSDLSKEIKDLKVDSDLSAIADKLIEEVSSAEIDIILLPCGSPAFAWLLSRKLNLNLKCLFAHSDRDSIEKHVEKELNVVNESGEIEKKKITIVEKQVIFKHVKWIEV